MKTRQLMLKNLSEEVPNMPCMACGQYKLDQPANSAVKRTFSFATYIHMLVSTPSPREEFLVEAMPPAISVMQKLKEAKKNYILLTEDEYNLIMRRFKAFPWSTATEMLMDLKKTLEEAPTVDGVLELKDKDGEKAKATVSSISGNGKRQAKQ